MVLPQLRSGLTSSWKAVSCIKHQPGHTKDVKNCYHNFPTLCTARKKKCGKNRKIRFLRLWKGTPGILSCLRGRHMLEACNLHLVMARSD